MARSRRRISYVIPPPSELAPHLQLPPHGISRLGSIGPLLVQPGGRVEEPEIDTYQRREHPRHRLGVSSLALDTCTQLSGRNEPEGILYSGGRDGLVISWELGIPMKKRVLIEEDVPRRAVGRWELMTGWADDVIDEEGEDGDERPHSDGDILGDVTIGMNRRRRRGTLSNDTIPYEYQWETDLETFKPRKPSQFRQCAQLHSDWVNDILLCNYNQTLVSASSDGTIKAWNPHSTSSPEPSLIGSHNDYARCLTYCREQNWIASGSFDRTIKLWDLSRSCHPSMTDALTTLHPVDANAPKSSVYAIAADPQGHAIASGSPERVVRIWDPRSGKRTGKLVGHTDNIRAILISDDARYLLTGSADASIKLWSLSSQRCLHTFTHHTDSVWSLFSTHPSFEIFYSGDRSGLVCKVDVENCTDLAEGECIVLCQDSSEESVSSPEGINKIVAMDDNLLWTAAGHSNIKRWRVPQRRVVRASAIIADVESIRLASDESPVMSREQTSGVDFPSRPSSGHGELQPPFAPPMPSSASDNWYPQREREGDQTLYGIPFESLVRLTSPDNPFITPSTRQLGRDSEVATLYSTASFVSVPQASGTRLSFQDPRLHSHTSPIRSSRTGDTVHPTNPAQARYEMREIAADAVPLCTVPDNVISGEHGLVRSILLNDRIHALTVDTSGVVAVWDIVRGVCRGRYTREDVAAASHRGSTTSESRLSGPKEGSPREALEAIRERIEGEAVVVPWSTVSTKTGVLTVDLNERCFEAEVYADEVGFVNDRHFSDESRLNIGKWVLRNLFLGFIREEQRIRANGETTSRDDILAPSLHRGNSIGSSADSSTKRSSASSGSSKRRSMTALTTVISAPKMHPALPPTVSMSSRSSPLLTPLIPLHTLGKDNAGTMPIAIPQSPTNADHMPISGRRMRSGTTESGAVSISVPPSAMGNKDADYFTIRARQASIQGGAPPTPDDFSGWAGPGKSSDITPTPSTPGGLMGRLKNLGKSATRRAGSEIATGSPVLGSTQTLAELQSTSEVEEPVPLQSAIKTPRQALLTNNFTPPSSTDAPYLNYPENLAITISEENSPGWTTIYRGTVSSTNRDVHALEGAMPMWLLEYLLLNKAPDVPLTKLSFILLPWPTKDPSEMLPELLNTAQSKLTASRFLRVRKLVIHVQDKLEKIAAASQSANNSPVRSSSENQRSPKSPRPKAEDLYEVLCNEVLLPLDMCLAAVRQYIWRQTGELVMHYRKKQK